MQIALSNFSKQDSAKKGERNFDQGRSAKELR
jgi:hypothetical protein